MKEEIYMLKEILSMIFNISQEDSEVNKEIEFRRIELLEEICQMELELAKLLADAEEYGNLDNSRDFRTVRVNQMKRRIEAKEKLLNGL